MHQFKCFTSLIWAGIVGNLIFACAFIWLNYFVVDLGENGQCESVYLVKYLIYTVSTKEIHKKKLNYVKYNFHMQFINKTRVYSNCKKSSRKIDGCNRN